MNVTSYAALFRDREDGGLGIVGIQIPMIQRDYAQGRDDPKAIRIRRDFIATLIAAIMPDPTHQATPIGLDFIYGHVRRNVLLPLDGQQRLTALFLLHWYLAVRSGGTDAPWLQFSYETRASARRFCEELRKAGALNVATEYRPDFSAQTPADWIKDQSWFMPGWKSEPTISSMLVVLDYMHTLFAGADAKTALERLTDPQHPSIHFHALNLADMDLGDDIYVRMNSRGKPLTDFEIFKARFGARLEQFAPNRVHEFAQLVDGPWLDTFWGALAAGTDEPPPAAEIDAGILRYMRYLADFVDAREAGRIAEGSSEADVCLRVFGDEASDARLDWLFGAFKLWSSNDNLSWFDSQFRDAREVVNEADAKMPIFDPGQCGPNLFFACCKGYSPERHKTEFPTRLALLLHAVLISQCARDETTMRRLRIVRNLVDWSVDEIRPESMGRLIEQTEQIMAGSLPTSTGFNAAQMEDERRKKELLEQNYLLGPTLQKLEDHDLLRGRLLAFSLDPETLPAHAAAFATTFGPNMNFDRIAAALLAADDYTDRGYVVRRFVPARRHERGWREVLTYVLRNTTKSPVANPLHAVLTCVSEANQAPEESLDAVIVQPFLHKRSSAKWLDWRYYFVAYPPMRESSAGCYTPGKVDEAVRMGYVIRRHYNVEWAYRDSDPYLDALSISVEKEMRVRLIREQTEQAESGQWLHLDPSGITLASRQDGWRIYLPDGEATNAAIQSVFAEFGVHQRVTSLEAEDPSIAAFWHFPIAQSDNVPDGITPLSTRDVSMVDCEDRIACAASLVTSLLRATDQAQSAVTQEAIAGEEPLDDFLPDPLI